MSAIENAPESLVDALREKAGPDISTVALPTTAPAGSKIVPFKISNGEMSNNRKIRAAMILSPSEKSPHSNEWLNRSPDLRLPRTSHRSEERRVGKECRS